MHFLMPGVRVAQGGKTGSEPSLKIVGMDVSGMAGGGKFGALAAVLFVAMHVSAQVEYVDPTIGNVSILLVPTRPTVYMPNSMVRMYPMRADALDDEIKSFPLTINSHRMQELFSIMPGPDGPSAYDQEKTTPYFYSTRFDGSQTQVEFTATERCGYFRFGFPDGKARVVLRNRMA